MADHNGGLRRRRRNHVGGRRLRIDVTVTESERAQLIEAADRAGVSVPRLMVSGALGAPKPVAGHAEKVEAWKEATALRNLISGLAVNMNQIARHANSEHEVPPDFEAAVDAAYRACDRVRDAFGEVFSVRFPGADRKEPPQ